MRHWIGIALLTTSALWAARTAEAICAAPPPKICNAFFKADVVLLGTVLAEQRDSEWIRYKFEIQRTLKGESRAIRSVFTGNDSGRLSLDVGSEYVVFGYWNSGRLVVGCDEQALSDTAESRMVVREIDQLLASKPEMSSVEGQVVKFGDFSAPLAGVSVTVTGTGSKYTAMSDSGGQFLMSVRPGTYRVEVDSSVVEQTIYSEIYTDVKSLHLEPGQCAQLQYQGVHR
jgi:hypothetical protein